MRYKIVDRSGVESNSDDTFEDVAAVVTRGTAVSNQESQQEERRENRSSEKRSPSLRYSYLLT